MSRSRAPGVGCLILVVLLLAGCASTTNVPESLPESEDSPAGDGTAIGSILMSAPTGMSDADKQEMIESLKKGTFEAIVRRFVVHDLGISSWTQYLGPKYQVLFEIGVEKQIVLRAPAGTYSFLTITETFPGILGLRLEGCTMSDVAGFRIHEGKATYIGRLTIMAGFKSDEDLKMQRSMDTARGMMVLGVPERSLNMNIGVTDVKEETLQGLGMQGAGPASESNTELMGIADTKGNWHYTPQPAPSPPKPPEHR